MKLRNANPEPHDWNVSRIKIYIYFDSSQLRTITNVMEGISHILKAVYLPI